MDEKLRLAETELQMVAENLAAAALLADKALYRKAVADLYHAAYHSAVALLAAHGMEAGSHDDINPEPDEARLAAQRGRAIAFGTII